MKIKRFKLKEGVTREYLIGLGARVGGSWIMSRSEDKNNTLFIHNGCYRKDSQLEISFDIGFGENLDTWNDTDCIIVLDDDFCQPYIPFYTHFHEDVTGFPALEFVIEKYNEYMSSLPFLEEKGKQE